MRKRLLATLLAVLMVFSLLPATALADTGASSEYTATIGGQGYANLPTAMNNAESGDVIVLHKDISWPRNPWTVFSGSTGKAVTLDLNGHTMSMGKTIVVSGSGNALTIIDSVGGGSIDVKQRAFNVKGATLTIEGGSFTYTTGLASTSNGGVVNVNGGTFNMNVNNTSFNVTTYGVKANNLFSYYGEWDDAEAAAIQSADDNAVIFAAPSTNSEINAPYVVSFVDNGSDNIAVASFSLAGTMQIRTPDVPEHDNNVTFAGWWDGEKGSEFIPANALTKVSDGVTFTAVWNPIVPEQVTVTADLAGGKIGDFEGTAVGQYDVGTVYAPDTPEREGYEFLGWFVDGGSTQWTSGTLTGDLNLVAKWEQIEYKVQFDPNGGNWDGSSESIIQQVADGSIASVKPADPVRPGYTFTGWWYNDEPWNFETDTVGGDLTLTAGWTEDTYTLTIVWGNGTNDQVIGDLTYGSTYNVNAPEWQGHTFSHWVDADGSTWTPGTTQITADTTITAVWDTNTVKVDFNIDGVVVHSANVEYGAPVESYTPADIPEGYTFDGWYADNSLSGDKWAFTTAVENDMTLYGSFIADEYTVTFDANAGEDAVTGVPAQQVVKHGERTTVTGTPERKYYTFKGWATTADAAEPNFITGPSGTPVTEATTLYAVWERDEIEITLKANTGVFENNSDTYKFTIYAGETIDWPQVEQPTKEGHHFLGWYWSNLTTPVNNDQVFEVSSTLYAGWDINVYTVTYKAEGGTFTDGTTERTAQIEHGETFEVTDPVWGGHTFTGWLDENLQSWNTNTPITSDKTLTAAWDTNWYKVTFNFGNNSEPVVKTVKSGEQVAAPADPVREGYTFDYWYYDNPDEAFDFNTTIEGPVTLTAHWTQNVYRVTIQSGATDARLVVNGAYVEGTTFTVDVRYGQSVSDRISLNSPQRAGYNFSGWYVNGVSWDPSDAVTSDITVTANWNVGQYKVGFELNGGEGETPADQFIDHNGYVQDPGDPTREGYTFNGWHVGSETGPLWSFSDRVSADMTLVAGWGRASNYVQFVIKEPGVTFDNGESSYGEYVQYGDKVSAAIETPERDGYTFAGWFTEDGAQWNESTPVTSAVTYYATWTPVMHTVSFNTDGGSTIDSITVQHGSTITKPADPTKEGYTFAGWYYDEGGESGHTAWDFDSRTVLSNITLIAHWTSDTYSVTYVGLDSNGAKLQYTLGSEIAYGNKVSPTPSANVWDAVPGMSLVGWYTTSDYQDGTEWNFAEDTVTQNTVLYAKYEARTYTITFNANGGEGSEYTQTFTFGEPQQLKANGFVNEGYTFAGWTLDRSTEEILFQDQQIVTFDNADENSDFTVYAVWTQVTHQVTFVGMNGAPDGPYTVAHNGKITATQNLNAAGYTITGWYLNKEFSGEAWNFNEDTVTTDITLYAEYEEVNYTVTFDANGGEGTMDPQVFRYNQPQYLTKNTFTREGYTFAGWSTDPNAATATYYDQQQFTFGEGNSNITIYAVWTTVQYTVTFDANGGTWGEGVDNVQYVSVNAGSSVEFLNEPTNVGYTFGGWYRDTNLNGTIDENETIWLERYTVGNNITLLAKWDANVLDFTYYRYNDDGGSPYTDSSSLTFPYGTVVTVNVNGGTYYEKTGTYTGTVTDAAESRVLDSTAAWTGHDFLGWKYTVEDGEHIFTAMWSNTGYTLTFDANGGTLNGAETQQYDVVYGETIGLPTPERVGYTFAGWYYLNENDEVLEGFNGLASTTYDWDWNVTLTAVWTQEAYTVTFMDGDDVIGENTNYAYGMKITVPSDLDWNDHTGETLEGWYTDAGFANKWNFDTMTVTGNVTLYAKYETEVYEVTFHGNGGAAANGAETYVASVNYQNVAYTPGANYFTREGYLFLGWSYAQNYELAVDANAEYVTVDKSIDLYAVWAEILDWGELEYTDGQYPAKKVTYENIKITAASGITEFSRGGVGKGDTLTLRPKNNAPSSEPYSNLISVSLANGETRYIIASFKIVPVGLDITTDIDYNKVYVVPEWGNGEAVGNTVNVYVTGAPGQDISINLENNDGVLEIANPNNPITEYTNDNGTSTYEAVYKVVGIPRDEVTITFTATDSFGTTASISQTMKLRTVVYAFLKDSDGTPLNIEAGNVALHSDKDPYDHPPLAMTYNESLGCFVALADQATGYDYLHFVTTDGREVFVRNTTAAGETITYALSGLGDTDGEVTIDYTFGAYTVIAQLNVNGTPVDRETYSVSGNYGAEIPFSEISAWASGRVNTWLYPNADEGSYNITFTTMDGKPVTFGTYGDDVVEWVDNTVYVYANVTVGSYVEFDLNYDANNDGNPANDMYGDPVFILDGGAVNKPDPDPTRAGYLFTGWYTDAACTNLYDFALPVTGYLKLYAGWDKNTYTVTFNNGYGDDYAAGTPWAPQYVEYQGYLTAPTENPTRDGYKFLGWSTEPDGTAYWNFTQNQVLGSFTLYAVWEQNDYTLYYHNVENANNAALFYNVTPIHYGDVINEPEENPERDSFIFQGWYTDAGCTEPAQFPITVGEGDVHLYAKWADAVTVYFVYNDGSGLIDSVKIVKGTAVPEPEIPTYAGHYFTGWYAGVENYGEESENWTNAYEWDFDTQVNDTIFLYAGWESATIQGNFFNKTPTGVYVALERQDYTGNWVPASGIDDLTVGAWRLVNGQPDSDENLLFPGVHMTEILPGSELWQSGWDPDYAYYYATWDTALTGSVRFYLEAEGYTFVSTPGQVG